MEVPHSGMMGQSGYAMNTVSPMMPPGPNYPPVMNPAMAPGFYLPINKNPLVPQNAPSAGDGGGKFLPPPPPVVGPGPDAPPQPSDKDWTIPSISQETAKQALLDYVSGHCCYGSSPVKGMEIQEMKPLITYRYRLETFTESRACDWTTKPLTNVTLDGPSNGPAPQPWAITLEPPPLFHDETRKQPVPHTSSMKQCEVCHGKGKIVCPKCNGNGRVECESCNGSGRGVSEDNCSRCSGRGKQGCPTCHQRNVVTCPCCVGMGQVISFIELTVTWKNNLYEFLPDHHSEFNTDLFKTVTGEKIFTDEQLLVPPLLNFPDASISQASQKAVQQHYSQFTSSSRILKQKQSIEWLPLTKVEYSWKGKNCSYFVYGQENQVETKDYPSTCCCVIL